MSLRRRSLQRRRIARSVETDLRRAPLRAEVPASAEKPVHLILGVSATGDVGVAATLAGEWLANVFGRPFTAVRSGESSLGVEAFYDALSHPVADRAFVGAIGLDETSATRAASRPAASALDAARFELADAADPVTLHVEGIAHALFDRASGQALVMFDRLPGAIELASEPAPARALHSDAEARMEAVAWYGFGTMQRRRSHGRRGLRSGISHGLVAGEPKNLLAGVSVR